MNGASVGGEVEEMLSVDEMWMMGFDRGSPARDLAASPVHSHPLRLPSHHPLSRPPPPSTVSQNPLSSPFHNSTSSHIPYKAPASPTHFSSSPPQHIQTVPETYITLHQPMAIRPPRLRRVQSRE